MENIIKEWTEMINDGYGFRDIAEKYGLTFEFVKEAFFNFGYRFEKTVPTNKLYKGKYYIGVYDLKNRLVKIFDNYHDAAKILNKAKTTVRNSIDSGRNFRINDQWYKLKTIQIKEEDKENECY